MQFQEKTMFSLQKAAMLVEFSREVEGSFDERHASTTPDR